VRFPTKKDELDTISISKVDQSNRSSGSRFEKTDTDNDMEKCESLMGNEDVSIDQSNKKELHLDLVGPRGDQGIKKNPSARVLSPNHRRGGLIIKASDLDDLAKLIINIHDTS
jgi:hypothetical protein